MKSGACKDVFQGQDQTTEYQQTVLEGDSKNAFRTEMTLDTSVDQFQSKGGPQLILERLSLLTGLA